MFARFLPSATRRCARWSVGRAVARRSVHTSGVALSARDAIFTEQHDAMREALTTFVEAEINPHVDRWEEDGIFPAHELFKKMGDHGFLGVTKPEQFGGLGLDYTFGVVVAEALGGITCGGVPMAIGVQVDMATPALAKFGSDAVREQFLRPSIAGDYVACLGVSEVGAGSDVSAVKTTAVRDGDEYVINGGKMWTTNGTQADWMCLLANTGDGPVHANKSLICVPMDAEGVSVAPRFKKLGMRSSDTTQVWLEDVRVPVANLIGEEGKGFQYQMIQFQEERLFAAASLLAAFERCLQHTWRYAAQRQIFGQPLVAHQTVHFRLCELETEVEALRALVYRATALYVQGENVTRLASMAKLKVGRLGRELSDACLQFFGGMGFMEDNYVSRCYRDWRLISIGGGADEVMLSILAKLQQKRFSE